MEFHGLTWSYIILALTISEQCDLVVSTYSLAYWAAVSMMAIRVRVLSLFTHSYCSKPVWLSSMDHKGKNVKTFPCSFPCISNKPFGENELACVWNDVRVSKSWRVFIFGWLFQWCLLPGLPVRWVDFWLIGISRLSLSKQNKRSVFVLQKNLPRGWVREETDFTMV